MRSSAINAEKRRDKRSLEAIIVKIDPGSRTTPRNANTIFRVPRSLREVDPDAFEPKMVALGPYHAREGDLQEMEDQKLHCLRRFLDRVALPDGQRHSSSDNVVAAKLELCTAELTRLEREARSCYCGDIDMDPDCFTETMLLDGCFVLEVLREGKKAISPPWKYHLVAVDMLMLENQIPFPVLEKLLELIPDDSNRRNLADLVFKFACSFMGEFAQKQQSSSIDPCHLLHQIYLWMIPSEVAHKSSGSRLGEQVKSPMAKGITIPGAVALREAGVKFRAKNGGAPLALTFQDGVLEMSAVKIYEHHRFLVRNLVAMEHCFNERSYVTDHVFFVSRLMSTARDVALLHDKGVVVNGLGSEEEVARLAGSLSKNVVWNPEANELREVFLGIDRHRNVRRNRWKATWVREYFGSPWSIISLLAASSLLIFTLLQTVYTVLSYFKS